MPKRVKYIMIKWIGKYLLFGWLLFCCTTSLYAQRFYDPKGSFSIDLGIPTAENSPVFELCQEGLFNGGLGYQYNVYNGLTLGGGAKYSFFVNDRFALNQTIGTGGLHVPAVYLKVGYEKFTSDRFSFNFSIRGGYTNFIAINDSTKANLGGSYVVDAFFVEPQMELLLTTELNEPHAFSFVLGYSIYFQEYTTDFVSRDKFIGVLDEDTKGNIRFLSIGFGYRYYFGMN